MNNFALGITKPCTQLHAAPSTSTQLQPAPSTTTQLHPAPSTTTQLILTSTHLHSPPPSSFKPPPSSLQHPQRYKNQNIARNRAISQIEAENSKLPVLPENWHSWYIGGADSKSRLRISKFRPQNLFFGNFRPKK